MLNADLLRHRLEFARALDRHQYDVSPQGLYFPKQHALVRGQFDTWINGADHQLDPNIVPAEGLAQILKAGVGAGGYIAPFVNNTTPLAGLTAATFAATLGEFLTYDEGARQAWTIPADPVAGAYDNSASPAVFTAGAVGGGGQAIYGAAILTASAKGATTGKLICASKFAAARTLFATDKLTVQYTLSATSA